ncbi:uncharacterized protein LOC105284485 isoform X3 [Ooceraea biroi]|uniref:uncharacterized protein LOC105284485 isoform X3 n=1 Tax=Ooceraea biroi TaxID=2015173 RepID=UPI00097171B5|nr:uncharacterized protein LOC105284485 isoform X3 [Ooceraea biroi]
MGRHCCVKGCTTGVNLPSHIFPKDVILLNKWKKAIFGEGYSENIQGLTDEQLRKCVVCYKHFADSDYVETYRLRRLKAGVIPSLHLPNHSNNNSEVNDNDSETSNSKNSSNNANNAEHHIKNVTTEVISTRMEVTTKKDPTVEKIEGIGAMREEQSVREVSQSMKNLLNGNSSVSSPSESELQFQEPRFSGLRHLEPPELVKLGTQEPILPEAKLAEARSPKSGSFLPKNSTHSLLELHNLLQGKYFHKFTPKIWNLYKLCCILKKKQEAVAKRQLTFCERVRQAKKYGKSPAIEKLLSSLTPIQRTFLQMQMKATKYAPKDRRFTLDEKIAALSIMKQSSKCYQYLTQVFNLPSTCTLQSILQTVNIHPGPIPFVNRRLKKRVKLMKEREKVCFVTWDEMLLQPHLDYDTRKKHILGFEDFGKMRCARFADHALVFMVHGIQSGWKFPLAYYFCDGAAQTDQLVEWIKTVAKIIIDSGLHLVALICNDGKRNITAVNKLKLESAKLKSKREQLYYGNITVNEQDIIPLYDPPHLIKGIRNNLLNGDLEFDRAEGEEQKYASWEIIEQAYHMDLTHNVYRLMPKITADHVIKNRVKIKKVKTATQVLSMTMGGFIHHHTKMRKYNQWTIKDAEEKRTGYSRDNIFLRSVV